MAQTIILRCTKDSALDLSSIKDVMGNKVILTARGTDGASRECFPDVLENAHVLAFKKAGWLEVDEAPVANAGGDPPAPPAPAVIVPPPPAAPPAPSEPAPVEVAPVEVAASVAEETVAVTEEAVTVSSEAGDPSDAPTRKSPRRR